MNIYILNVAAHGKFENSGQGLAKKAEILNSYKTVMDE
jgi:hypothetical protein